MKPTYDFIQNAINEATQHLTTQEQANVQAAFDAPFEKQSATLEALTETERTAFNTAMDSAVNQRVGADGSRLAAGTLTKILNSPGGSGKWLAPTGRDPKIER